MLWRSSLLVTAVGGSRLPYSNSKTASQTTASPILYGKCSASAPNCEWYFATGKILRDGSRLVRHLSTEVARAMEVPERTALGGETSSLWVPEMRARTFPYGFFKDWLFDA